MKKILFSVISFIFLSSFAQADIGDILSMQRNENNNFDVVCSTSSGNYFSNDVSADAIRTDSVCKPAQALTEGYYTTTASYCPQTVKWNGPTLTLQTSGGCDVLVVLDYSSPGVYIGHIQGYNLTYRVTIKDPKSYLFETVDLGTQGVFTYSSASNLRNSHSRQVSATDPTQVAK